MFRNYISFKNSIILVSLIHVALIAAYALWILVVAMIQPNTIELKVGIINAKDIPVISPAQTAIKQLEKTALKPMQQKQLSRTENIENNVPKKIPEPLNRAQIAQPSPIMQKPILQQATPMPVPVSPILTPNKAQSSKPVTKTKSKSDKSITKDVLNNNLLKTLEKVTSIKDDSYDNADNLTLPEAEALRGQFRVCWLAQAGSPNPKDLVVRLRLDMNPDATVKRVTVVNDNGRSKTDSFFRVAVERAIQSFYLEGCKKLQLPLGEYERWKVLYMDFNPSSFR